MRAALVDSNYRVVNVIEYNPEATYQPEDGLELVELTESDIVGPTWRRVNGTFVPPPVESLTALPPEIPADGIAISTVSYTNTFDNAPAQVTFDVNGGTQTVDLVGGVAELVITASYVGDIVVKCNGLDATCTALEVDNATV